MESSEKNGYFDLNAIKERLREARSRSGMTQTDLSKKLEISQPTLSKCLDECSESFFSVKQLFSFCLSLGLSMDEITGLKEAAEKTKKPSLSDVCMALYSLCKIVPLKWETITVNDKEYTACYSDTKTVNTLFTDVSYFSKSSDFDFVLDAWKDAFIQRNRNRLQEYSFQTKEEFAYSWLNRWVNDTSKTAINFILERNQLSLSDFEKREMEVLNFYRLLYGDYQTNGCPVKLMYEYADAYIKKNRISETHDTYYSLTKFKEIYEENNHPLPVSAGTLHTL